MKQKTKNILTIIILGMLILAFIQSKAQRSTDSFQAIEFTFGNEDKSPGFNAYLFHKGFGLVGGYQVGNYRYGDLAKTEHQKYRFGIAVNMVASSNYHDPGSFIFYAAGCNHNYNEVYDYGDKIKNDLPEQTIEIGAKYVFQNGIFAGFQCDLMHRTGGFSLGICINKNKRRKF